MIIIYWIKNYESDFLWQMLLLRADKVILFQTRAKLLGLDHTWLKESKRVW